MWLLEFTASFGPHFLTFHLYLGLSFLFKLLLIPWATNSLPKTSSDYLCPASVCGRKSKLVSSTGKERKVTDVHRVNEFLKNKHVTEQMEDQIRSSIFVLNVSILKLTEIQ